MKTGPLTIFMFGYDGWGNATQQLVKSVDAVERSRGFGGPLFVDTRIRRNVRAAGFIGDTFEKNFGRARYRWMPCLGNQRILDKKDGIKIKCPAAAETLLDLALDAAQRKQRIIFFCSCELPCDCHRYKVAELLIKAAKRRRIDLEVVEWPGDVPKKLTLRTPKVPLPGDRASRLTLPPRTRLTQYAGLALGSLVTVKGKDGESRTVAVAPAMYGPKGWFLPTLWGDGDRLIPGTKRAAHAWRKDCGYLPLRT